MSDSIGETGELVVKAAATQFNLENIDIRRIPYLNSVGDVEEALAEVAASKAAVIYTLVRPDLKEALEAKAKALSLKCVDIMGPVLDILKDATATSPLSEPGRLRKLDDAYFHKIEAIDFAINYDDGKQPWGLSKADLVIVGVSRTSKTPLCMYLAHKGIMAANVPLVPDVAPPEELMQLPKSKIVGLTISPLILYEIRKERLKTLGLAESSDYANLARIAEELNYATGIMRKTGCPIFDVTNRAVEETAAKILDIYRKGF